MVKNYFAACLVLAFIWDASNLSVFGQVSDRPLRANASIRGVPNHGLEYLVTNSAVIKELAISDDAYDKLVRATEGLRTEIRVATEDAAALEMGTPEYAEGRRKLAETTKAAKEAFLVKVKEILTPEQFARAQQISYRIRGVDAFNDPEVAGLLELSSEQLQHIARIKTEFARKRRDFVLERNWDGRTITTQLQDIQKEQESQIVGVLNPEQLATWTKIKGKDFDASQTRGAVVARSGDDLVSDPSTATNSELDSISRIGPPYNRGGRDVLSLVVNDEVAKELSLSAEAANKLKKLALERNVEIREGARDIVRTVISRLSPDQVKTLEERTKVICETYVPKVKAILSEKQYTRAQQICWQASGNEVYYDPEVIQALGLTKEQQDKITTLVKESRERSSAFSRSGSGYELGDELSKLPRQLADVLTAEQTAKLNALKGERFDLFKTLRVRPRPGRFDADQPPVELARILSAQPDVLAMAANGAVIQELGLSDETAAKLKQLLEAKNAEIKKVTDAKYAELDGAAGGPQQSRGEEFFSQRRKLIEEIGNTVRSTYVPKIKEILTAEQYTRLQQIAWQRAGVTVLNNPEVAQLLGLTQEQQDKIANLTKESIARRRASIATIDDRGLSTEERRAAAEEPRKQIPAVLTAEQAAKWETLKGKPFDWPKTFGGNRVDQ